MNDTVIKAILSINPNAEASVSGNDINNIHTNTDTITDTDTDSTGNKDRNRNVLPYQSNMAIRELLLPRASIR